MMSTAQEMCESHKLSVLIVDGFSNHNWKQTTVLAKKILEETELFEVDVSTAPATQTATGWDAWRPQFSDYDVVVQTCNSYGGRPTWPVDVQKDLEAYVSQGGGLYIYHAANNSFPEWGEYNRMIGLGWRNKDFGFAITIDEDGGVVRIPAGMGGDIGHGPRSDVVMSRLGDHPIHAGLPARWIAADLEIYQYARGPAENIQVLSYARDLEMDLNFPTEWVVLYGDGRVYNSTFGHVWKGDTNPPGMQCFAFKTLLIRAVQWVAGSEVSWSVPEQFSATR